MTDEVDELKNTFKDFKILAANVNDDKKNKKKTLDKTKELLEICKKEYQKLYFEHENLKKLYDNLVTQYNRTRKKKLIQAKKIKIVIRQDFEETESEKSDEENEEEEQTEEESGSDKVIPGKKTKKKNINKKKIAKKSNKRTTKKQVGIIDYINK